MFVCFVNFFHGVTKISAAILSLNRPFTSVFIAKSVMGTKSFSVSIVIKIGNWLYSLS